jgi:betaine lipid synthase
LIGEFDSFSFFDWRLLMMDRVNMYASTWICTKEVGIEHEDVKAGLRKTSLAELKLEAPAMRVE